MVEETVVSAVSRDTLKEAPVWSVAVAPGRLDLLLEASAPERR